MVDPTTVARWTHSLGLVVTWSPPRKPHRVAASQVVKEKLSRPRDRAQTARGEATRRRDWIALDLGCCDRIREVTTHILKSSPPCRISIAEIERRMGRRAWITKRREKLPLSIASLETVTETDAEFEARRIGWALKKLSDDAEPIRAWKVMRIAGLHSDALPRIRAVIVSRDGEH
jgi:hypothetical protein